MKKIIAFMLALTMFFTLGTTAFAATVSSNITENTIINSENVYDVVAYLGLDKDDVVFYDTKVFTNEDVTVNDIKEAMKKTNEEEVSIKSSLNLAPSEGSLAENRESGTKASGTKTVHRTSNITSSMEITYSVTGTYYKSSSIKYWKTATGSDISAESTHAIYFYEIDDIYEQEVTVEDAYTRDSNIRFDYDFDVGTYLGVDDFAIRINSTNISGHSNFYGSTCL